MKKNFAKLLGVAVAGILTFGMLTGCGSDGEKTDSTASQTEDSAQTDDTADEGKTDEGKTVKIGVLVADVSGEEALGFRSYYENYIADNYNVEFSYTDALESAEAEKAAIEKFAAQGYEAVISLSSSDRAMQIETCEELGVYYAIASGVLDESQYDNYKGNEYFAGQVGPSNQTEYEAGQEMGAYFKEQGVKKVALYGAFIPNPMHVYRTAGVIVGLGDTYGGASDMDAIAGQIFQDQSVDLTKVAGDVEIAAYLQGYGDTTTDELNAAIQKEPEVFISVGMATTFFAQPLNEAGIAFSDIDSFTEMNSSSIKEGKLAYLAGKYSSSIGPVFALVMNAVNGNVIRDPEGNAVSFSQGYLVATDGEAFDQYYVSDNGDSPIYNKETLNGMIGDDITYDLVKSLIESE